MVSGLQLFNLAQLVMARRHTSLPGHILHSDSKWGLFHRRENLIQEVTTVDKTVVAVVMVVIVAGDDAGIADRNA
jgi:hypothetical protein